MRIRFQSRHGMREVEIRDITGGHEYALWRNGDEKDVPDDATISVREQNGKIVRKSAINSLFECGQDFVDVATGKNPLFSCKRCGAEALDMHFYNRMTLELMPLTDENDYRLCLADWLAEHPEYVPHHRKMGIDEAIIEKAASIREERAAKAAPSSAPAVAKPRISVPAPDASNAPATEGA